MELSVTCHSLRTRVFPNKSAVKQNAELSKQNGYVTISISMLSYKSGSYLEKKTWNQKLNCQLKINGLF